MKPTDQSNFEQVEVVDGLIVYLVPVDLISELGHGYEGQELEDEPFYLEEELPDIKATGIRTPLVLYKDTKLKSKFLICDGWHRWKIAIRLKMDKVPAVIFNSISKCKPTENIPW